MLPPLTPNIHIQPPNTPCCHTPTRTPTPEPLSLKSYTPIPGQARMLFNHPVAIQQEADARYGTLEKVRVEG